MSAVNHLADAFDQMLVAPPKLEDQLGNLDSPQRVIDFLYRGIDFDRNTIVQVILHNRHICFSVELLEHLIEFGSVCPEDIYERIGHCRGTIDELIDYLLSKGVLPRNPSARTLEIALQAHCSADTFFALVERGCQPDQSTFAFAGRCQMPSAILEHLFRSELQPTSELLLQFLENLENHTDDLYFMIAFKTLIERLPIEEGTTAEMLHIAIEVGLSDEALFILATRGATPTQFTYVKLIMDARTIRNLQWMIPVLMEGLHPFVSEAIKQNRAGAFNVATLQSTLNEKEACTTEVLNIALELNLPEGFVRALLHEGAKPGRDTLHFLRRRGLLQEFA